MDFDLFSGILRLDELSLSTLVNIFQGYNLLETCFWYSYHQKTLP